MSAQELPLTIDEQHERRRGSFYAFGAYTLWGLFPIYWKWLQKFSSFEILAHRVAWAFVFYWLLLVFIRRESAWQWLRIFARATSRNAVIAASILLTGNWLLYIWAVNSGHVIDASLGYFITPLLNVSMGWLILKERLSPLRWAAVALAAAGVTALAIQTGGFPFIAMGLALTFATYGLIRKQIRADVFETSTAETFVMVIPALAVMAYSRFAVPDTPTVHALDLALMIGSGLVTGLPLIWFAQAARRLPLSMLGFFQYIAPSVQFALGAFVYGEALTTTKLQAFGFIWCALALFSWESLRRKPNPHPL